MRVDEGRDTDLPLEPSPDKYEGMCLSGEGGEEPVLIVTPDLSYVSGGGVWRKRIG